MLIDWIAARCKTKLEIASPCNGLPYLTRYYLLGTRSSRWALHLHHIHQSDTDRDLHDHPWGFWSLILKGGYYEMTSKGFAWKRVGSLLRRPATWKHRVVLWCMSSEVWTLVLRFPYERKWGFHTAKGFVPHDQYDYKAGCE